MRAANAFNLNRLHSRSLSRRPCSLGCLAVALTLVLTAENHREIFECAHLKFTVSGRSKQTNKHTHTSAQCSHASVGLTQARPNNSNIALDSWAFLISMKLYECANQVAVCLITRY